MYANLSEVYLYIFLYIYIYISIPSFQTIENDQKGVDSIAKANKQKNRYINIHTCM